ncbi:MAG TPA: FKBP-type peptidyl-prolyl cis-trans isomerase [Phenylobacterium sp.]|jgi:FKBP-type peptidyl-prolyl cis-trans isomerase|nr:FKBP-type peptidyl-prolyl cis-trans isomerase [Phenylobacterium sp.]
MIKAVAVAAVLTASLGLARAASAQLRDVRPVTLPGIRYEVLASGPAGGAHPTRSETVAMRYIGRLSTSEIFSTSAEGGAAASEFRVRDVIPGMSAALQLMRPGDRWRISIPAYLAYGALGRRYKSPEEHLRRDIPPDATLVFDVELVGISGGGR